MFARLFRKFLLYLKDVQDIGFFTAMLDSRWLTAFKLTPFYQVLFPLLGISHIGLTVIELYELVKSPNKNIDRVSHLVVSLIGTTLSAVAIFGALIAGFMGTAFVAGPWFFLASMTLAIGYQSLMVLVNGIRVGVAPSGASGRATYLNAALGNAFMTAILLSVTGSLVFVLATPVLPVLGALFSAITLAMVVSNLVWKLLPEQSKLKLKTYVHLHHDEAENQKITPELEGPQKPCGISGSFWHAPDYTWEFYKFHRAEGKTEYLSRIIEEKVEKLRQQNNPDSAVVTDKINALFDIQQELHSGVKVSKKELIEKYPLVFQSFWLDIGEVESIVNAVVSLQEINEEHVHRRTPC